MILISLILTLLIKFTSSQGSCGNPLAKLYEDVQTLGTAVSLNETYIECKNLMDVTCCNEEYHKNLAFKFKEKKTEQLLFWEKFFVAKAEEFMTTYKSFVEWYSLNESPVETATAEEDYAHYQNLIDEVKIEKSICFKYLWQHTATMKCYVCLSDYTTHFEQLRNKTINMFMSENMCQLIQRKCTPYVGNFIHLAEKAKYLYTYIRSALKAPNYSEIEQVEVNELEEYLTPMRNCNATGFCRGLCEKMIDGTGFHANYSMPYMKYFEWFIDGFRTLKKAKEVESELAGTTTRIIQDIFNEPLKFGPIPIQTKEKQSRVVSQSAKGRVMEELTAYEQLLASSSTFKSRPLYSSSYVLDTFTLSSQLQNITFTDTVEGLNSRIYTISVVIFSLLILLVRI